MRAGRATIERLARGRLGFERLRPGQLRAVQALAAGRDALAVLPTGGGKSAIYELAGLLREGPTVVVSPLIALQDDQLAHLNAAGLRAVVLNSQQPPALARQRSSPPATPALSSSSHRSNSRTRKPVRRCNARGRACSPWTKRT